jgi:putative peptidoglycan lipid II flippase
MILSKPIVAVLFEHGEFTSASTELTQDALLFYAIGLPAHAAIEILSRGFYAMGDTRTPVAFALVSMVLNVIFCAALVGPFDVRGLALALSIATTVEALLLAWTLRYRIEADDLRAFGLSLARTAMAALLMIEVVGLFLITLHQLGHLDTGSFADAFLALAGGSVLGVATFLCAARALRSEEAEVIVRRLPGPLRHALG